MPCFWPLSCSYQQPIQTVLLKEAFTATRPPDGLFTRSGQKSAVSVFCMTWVGEIVPIHLHQMHESQPWFSAMRDFLQKSKFSVRSLYLKFITLISSSGVSSAVSLTCHCTRLHDNGICCNKLYLKIQCHHLYKRFVREFRIKQVLQLSR
jgi:hypothetical protein